MFNVKQNIRFCMKIPLLKVFNCMYLIHKLGNCWVTFKRRSNPIWLDLSFIISQQLHLYGKYNLSLHAGYHNIAFNLGKCSILPRAVTVFTKLIAFFPIPCHPWKLYGFLNFQNTRPIYFNINLNNLHKPSLWTYIWKMYRN